MKYDEIIKDRMKLEYAIQISNWKYSEEYSDYNLPSYEEMKKKEYSITKKEKANNYIIYLLNSEVVAYVNMVPKENKLLYVGIGLSPSNCGKGYGNYFLLDSLEEMNKRYPDYKKYLEVRSFNKRAIKAYEKVGFKIINKVIKKDRFGNDTEFIEMEYFN